MRPLFQRAVRAFGIAGDGEAIVSALLEFLADRLKVALREKGARHDLISAVFARDLDDLGLIVTRARALQDFIGTDSGLNLLTAYRRANNIVRIETAKDSKSKGAGGAGHDGAVASNLLTQIEEKALASGLDEAEAWFKSHGIDSDLAGAMTTLSRLRAPVDAFFDKVTVNAEDADLRTNRLRLLSRIARTIDNVADFSRIEG